MSQTTSVPVFDTLFLNPKRKIQQELFINIGKAQKVKAKDILGAIAGEANIPGKLVGAIDLYDKYTFVEVPKEHARAVLKAMKNVKIKGKAINIEPANAR